MSAEFQQPRIELNLIPTPLQHGCFEIVIKNDARLAIPCLKRVDVTPEKVFRRLIEEEFQIQSARIGQRHHKTGQGAAGTTHHHMSEVRPVCLSLLSGKHLQTQIRLAAARAQAGHRTAQLGDTAAVAAVANHLEQAGGAQSRIAAPASRG
jgi:hypothetical protein